MVFANVTPIGFGIAKSDLSQDELGCNILDLLPDTILPLHLSIYNYSILKCISLFRSSGS